MFETSQQTNQRLYRAILDGKQYEKLIPKTYCQRLNGGKGNTDYSVNQMAKVVELYSHQTQKVAPKLQKSSLQETCQAVQDFLYWHFQYKRDEQDQLLRSPACSFAQRFEGIDCKSYSIFGASILRELGYVSYFRRASYGLNQSYSHVYVVVPKNQKTADLSQGYYVIDGTINQKTDNENYFYKHDDILIMKLNHYILNAPQDYNAHWVDSNGLTQYQRMYLYQRGVNPDSYGLGADDNTDDGLIKLLIDKGKKIFDGIFKGDGVNWQKLFNSKCWGSQAYSGGEIKADIEAIANFIEEDIVLMNSYLAKKDYKNFSIHARLIKTYIRMLEFIYYIKRHRTAWDGNNPPKDWSNTCTKFNFDDMVYYLGGDPKKLAAFINVLDAWLEDNFIREKKDPNVIILKQKFSDGHNFLGKLFLNNSSLVDTDKASKPVIVNGEKQFWFYENRVFKLDNKNGVILGQVDHDDQYYYTPKLDKEEITFFEMTDYLKKILKNETNEKIDVKKYLNSLKNTATLFYSSTTNVPTPPPPTNNNIPANNNIKSTALVDTKNNLSNIKNHLPADYKNAIRTANTTKQAGFPLFIGGAIVVAGAMYLYQQSKNKK